MGLFSKYLHLNELQVNGETVDDNDDFNMTDDTADTGADAGAEAPAAEANDAADDLTTEDEEDDFTLDDEDDVDETEDTGDDQGTENAEDDTEDNTEDSNDDFSVDGTDNAEAGETDETPGEDNGETNDAGKASDATPKDPTDGISDEDIKSAEESIYDSLTDDQKRIRVLQLKIDYKDLYETFMTTIEGINNIPTDMDNLETIKRLNTLLTKSKGILIDYINNNFDKNSYLENYSNYLKYMAVFRTASRVIEELNNAKK